MKLDHADLRALSHRSNARGLTHLAGHVAMLAATGTAVLATWPGPWAWPALLAHGIVLIFLFAPLHECVHRTAFRSVRLADGLAFVLGTLLLLPPAWFRAFHFAHHRHTQVPGLDPELDGKRVATWPDYLWHLSGLRYWQAGLRLLARQALGRVDEPFIPTRLRPRIVGEARLMLSLYAGVAIASVLTGSTSALLLWVLPALLGQPFLRAYLLAEHTGRPLVQSMWANTRTTFTLAPVRFLAWNMPFHSEHHAYPAVPFHRLPALHRRLKDRLVEPAPGYAAFHRDWQAGLGRRHAASPRLPIA